MAGSTLPAKMELVFVCGASHETPDICRPPTKPHCFCLHPRGVSAGAVGDAVKDFTISNTPTWIAMIMFGSALIMSTAPKEIRALCGVLWIAFGFALAIWEKAL